MTEEQKSEDLLSLDEAAQVLGISKPTLYRLLAAGDLRGIKVGRQWRFRNGDLKDYLERSPLSMSLPRTSEIEVEIAFFEEAMRSGGHEVPESTPDGNRTPAEQQALLLVDRIIQYAIILRASDIHVEPVHIDNSSVVLVRYRIDGVLQEIRRIPEQAREAVAASFKTAADLNVADRRSSQNRRISFRFIGKVFAILVATNPTLGGEDIVMRIVDNSSLVIGLGKIGLTTEDRSKIDRLIKQPNGLLIFAGPPGSGKTITLYSCLLSLASPQKKLITIEDPVAATLPYATQVQVDKHSDMTYESTLRAFFRHDPDIIYIDDIPNQETARLVANCALNGHLVLINLTAYDVSAAIKVLEDTGIEPHIAAASIAGIVAQRLVRKLCPACRKPAGPIDPSLLARVREMAAEGGYDLANDAVFYESVGCDLCGNRGYKGRAGLYEILEVTETILSAVARGAQPDEIRKLVRDTGTQSVFADGIQKAAEGLTTIDEVLRVTYSA